MTRDTNRRGVSRCFLLPHACWGSLTLHSTAPASLEIVEWVKTDVSLMFFFLIELETLGTLCWKEKGISCILGVCVSADTRYYNRTPPPVATHLCVAKCSYKHCYGLHQRMYMRCRWCRCKGLQQHKNIRW
jgi:ABC-type uncharacterized transport system permease subunit